MRWGCFTVFALPGVVASMFGGAAPTFAQQGQWVNQPAMNIARQECGAARIGESIYVVGGLLANFQATASVERHVLGSGLWTQIDPLPEPRDHMAVVELNGKLYAIGGYAGDFSARQQMYIYDPQVAAGTGWTTGTSLPSPRGACWAVTHQGKIYLFGGKDNFNITQNTTFVFNPQNNQWTLGANMPTAREHLNAAAAGDYIYVIGGRNGPSTNANHRYHPASNTWQVMAPMPTARSATALASFGRRIIVAGGEVPQLFAVNEIYDTKTNAWTTAAPMPVPRHGVAALSIATGMFAPAGGVVQGLQPTTHVDAFLPPALTGDANGDGWVNIDDLLAVINAWGPCPPPCPADLNHSGAVDIDDLLVVINDWG